MTGSTPPAPPDGFDGPDDRAEAADGDETVADPAAHLAPDGPETVAEKRLLASLGRQARAVNLARVVRLLELLDLSDERGLTEAERREAENQAHQVVGSAGTFGFPTASLDAVPIEDYFARRAATVTVSAAEVRTTLVRLRAQFAG